MRAFDLVPSQSFTSRLPATDGSLNAKCCMVHMVGDSDAIMPFQAMPCHARSQTAGVGQRELNHSFIVAFTSS